MVPEGDLLRNPWVRWPLYFGLWTFLGLFNVGQSYFILLWVGRPFELINALILGLSDWYLWAIFGLIIVWLGRLYPIERRVWVKSLILHCCVCFFFGFLTVLVCTPLFLALGVAEQRFLSFWDLFTRLFVRQILFYYWVYFAILGTSYALDYYRMYRERELKASQLETRLTRAQLQMLKMQLHPHFLFNTLHAISSLMHKDVNLADRMIARLGELLRLALKNDGTQEVPLRQEFEFLNPYLEIERARLGSRLTVRMDIEAEAMDALVPNLLLQPLIENAIHHGIAPRTDPGWIEVRARRHHLHLLLEVEDDGPGLRQGWPEGIGLSNTRARLQQLYPKNHRFELRRGSRGGLLVHILIPFREAVPSLDEGGLNGVGTLEQVEMEIH